VSVGHWFWLEEFFLSGLNPDVEGA
jgi:hypothetical protein